MTKPPTIPMVHRLDVKGFIWVPDAEIGDTVTIVLRGKVIKRTETAKEGEIVSVFAMAAERAMKVDFDPGQLLDVSNEQLMAEITSFLTVEDLEGLEDEGDTITEIKGQGEILPDAPPPGVDGETGEVDPPADTEG